MAEAVSLVTTQQVADLVTIPLYLPLKVIMEAHLMVPLAEAVAEAEVPTKRVVMQYLFLLLTLKLETVVMDHQIQSQVPM